MTFRRLLFTPLLAIAAYTSSPLVAQDTQAATDSVPRWLASNAIRLSTVEAGSGFDDMQGLRDVVGDARIVLLGEPTHGNREVYQLKHRVFEFLVEEMGFDAPERIEPHVRRFLDDAEDGVFGRNDAAGPDTIRYVEIVDGHAVGERLMWQEAPGIWRYIYDTGRFSWTRSERLVLGARGLPVEMEISGEVSSGIAWNERFKLEDGTARWFTPRERGEAAVSGPAYYTAINPAHDTGVLARALLRQETRALPLLPEGEARLELLGETVAAAAGRSRVVRHFAIHGLDLMPQYVWLDQEGATFADEWSIRDGWEAAFPALRALMDEARARAMRRMAADLVPSARTRPLVIRNARLFDAETGRVYDGTTIIIDGERIAAVGPASAVPEPAGAEMIDAGGRMALPGLWDMHAHHSIPLGRLEVDAPLHLAAGVTTARDLGSRVESLVALRTAIDEGQAVGPRILAAGYIDGAEGEKGGIGILVANEAEARAAVDRYAELGFVQIKTYNELPADLVHVVIARAKQHGMRVSGHVPWAMTSSEAVRAGYDEFQHIQMTLSALPRRGAEVITEGETWETWYQVLATLTPDSEPIQEFISLLASQDVAIDATMAHFISGGAPPDFMGDEVGRLPPPVERRMRHTTWAYPYVPIDPLARPAWQQTVQNMFGFLLAAHRAGVPILVGTDVWPGWGLHHEMELYVRAGMTTTDVLTLATLGAARVMGMDDELGSIEPGKLADLILVDGDPTTDIRDIRRVVTVIKDGRVYDPAAIYRALDVEPCCEAEPVDADAADPTPAPERIEAHVRRFLAGISPLERAYVPPPQLNDGWRTASAADAGLGPDRLALLRSSTSCSGCTSPTTMGCRQCERGRPTPGAPHRTHGDDTHDLDRTANR
ncbi:MAG: amidohydrolase family protein [Gemmatimonadota bacterium]